MGDLEIAVLQNLPGTPITSIIVTPTVRRTTSSVLVTGGNRRGRTRDVSEGKDYGGFVGTTRLVTQLHRESTDFRGH